MIFLLPKWDMLVTSLQGKNHQLYFEKGEGAISKTNSSHWALELFFWKAKKLPSLDDHINPTKQEVKGKSSTQVRAGHWSMGDVTVRSQEGFSDLMVPKNIRKASNWELLKLGNHIPMIFRENVYSSSPNPNWGDAHRSCLDNPSIYGMMRNIQKTLQGGLKVRTSMHNKNKAGKTSPNVSTTLSTRILRKTSWITKNNHAKKDIDYIFSWTKNVMNI